MEIDFNDYERSYLLTYLLNDRNENNVLDKIYQKLKNSIKLTEVKK